MNKQEEIKIEISDSAVLDFAYSDYKEQAKEEQEEILSFDDGYKNVDDLDIYGDMIMENTIYTLKENGINEIKLPFRNGKTKTSISKVKTEKMFNMDFDYSMIITISKTRKSYKVRLSHHDDPTGFERRFMIKKGGK